MDQQMDLALICITNSLLVATLSIIIIINKTMTYLKVYKKGVPADYKYLIPVMKVKRGKY